MERDYEVISLREWFTLFFIPILPTANDEGRDYFLNAGPVIVHTTQIC